MQAIVTKEAPEAIGPYSQAIIAGGFVFCSGQIPLKPDSGELISSDVQEQTHQVFRNLQAVLESAGSALEKVVKTEVFLQDMGDFAAMNEVYAQYFQPPFPARAAVEVACLPRNVLIEISCTAICAQSEES